MKRWARITLTGFGSVGILLLWFFTFAGLVIAFGTDIEYDDRQQTWLAVCAVGFTAIGILQAAIGRLPFVLAVLWVIWQVTSLVALATLFPTCSATTLPISLVAPMAFQLPLILLAIEKQQLRTYMVRSTLIGTSIWSALVLAFQWNKVPAMSDFPIAWHLLVLVLPLRDVALLVRSAGLEHERESLSIRPFFLSALALIVLAAGFGSGALWSYTSRTIPLAFRRVDRVDEFLITRAGDAVFYYRVRGGDWVSARGRESHAPFETDLDRARHYARQHWSIAVRIDPKLAPQWTRVGPFERLDDARLDPDSFRMPFPTGWVRDLAEAWYDKGLDSFIPKDWKTFVPREWGSFSEVPVSIRKRSGKPYADYLRSVYPKQGVVLISVYK